MKSGVLAPKLGFLVIAICYGTLFCALGTQSAVAFVKNLENRPHHVIFDDLGKMSTGVTYINIAIPLNISIMSEQIDMFSAYLDSLTKSNSTEGLSARETINVKNMEQLTIQMATYAKKRLNNLYYSLRSLDNLLPTDPSFDKNNDRHKRFVFLIPMIICEVNKGYWKAEAQNLTLQFDQIQKELDIYKNEYARLYEETMPDLIPEYIEDNHDALDEDTLGAHVEYLQRTKRDVQFLLNIIKNDTITSNISNKKPLIKPPTTPNPFYKFQNLYSKHKKQPNNTSFMLPGTSPLKYQQNLINTKTHSPKQHTHIQLTPNTPIRLEMGATDPSTLSPLNANSQSYLHPVNSLNKAFSHSELIDLDVPYAIRNRTKRFLPAVALAAGALGTFLGIFNAVEISNIRRDMATMNTNQNLLIQVQKIHTDQILQLEVGLLQLNDIFNLYLKNNPSLLYAKLEDVLQSLADRISDLKDTMQMLQLQRLSTSTLTSYQLTNLYHEVTALAKANNLSPLTNKPQDLFQLDTSYVRVANEILILIHVPCSNPSSLLTIYKYVPFPIPVRPQFNTNITVLDTIQDVFDISSATPDTLSEGIHFQPDADLIAIGKNDKGRHRYILLSSAEMSACTKRSQAYMCERHQVTKSDLLGSCLGSLYLQSPLGVATNCKISRIPLKETVYQISNTDHIVFTPYPITTQISCFNGSYFPLKIKNTQQIKVPEGCLVELTNHTITSDFSIRTTSDSVHFEWDFDPISLPNSAQLMLDSKSIDSKLKFLKSRIDNVHMGDIHARGFENLMVEHISSGSWLGTLFIVCFTIAGVLAILTGAICLRNYLLARGWIGGQPRNQTEPPHHRPRDYVTYHRGRDVSDDDEEMYRISRRISLSRTTQGTSTSETPPPFAHLVTPSAPEL